MNNIFNSGFVAVMGRPNAGKSTLINKIVGEKVSIVSNKPQTTRNNILAVYNEENMQIVFVDTPGIHKSHNKLGAYMQKSIKNARHDVDAIVYMLDCKIKKNEMDEEKDAIFSVAKDGVPLILALNKVDQIEKTRLLPLIDELKNLYPFAHIIPISAQRGNNVLELLNELKTFIKPGPRFFDDERKTDQTESVLIAEIIREKTLRLLNQEVPHGIAVEIEKLEKKKKLFEIYASINCEKTSHKGIIIGKGGEKLKEIGRQAREDLEKRFNSKIYLELFVKVEEDWRNRDSLLNNFGYES